MSTIRLHTVRSKLVNVVVRWGKIKDDNQIVGHVHVNQTTYTNDLVGLINMSGWLQHIGRHKSKLVEWKHEDEERRQGVKSSPLVNSKVEDSISKGIWMDVESMVRKEEELV